MKTIDILNNVKLPELLSLFKFDVIGDVPEETNHVRIHRNEKQSNLEYFVFINDSKDYFIINKNTLQTFSVKQFATSLFCESPNVELGKLEKIEPLLVLFRVKFSTIPSLATALVLGIEQHKSDLPYLNHASLKDKVFQRSGLVFPMFNKGEFLNLVTTENNGYSYYNSNENGVWNNTVSNPKFCFFSANPKHIIDLYANLIPDEYLCVLLHENVSLTTAQRLIKHAFDKQLNFLLFKATSAKDFHFTLHFITNLLSFNVGDSHFSINGNTANVTIPMTKDFLEIMSLVSDINYSLRCDFLGEEPKSFPDEIEEYFTLNLVSTNNEDESLELSFSLFEHHLIRFVELINSLYPINILLTDFTQSLDSEEKITVPTNPPVIEKIKKPIPSSEKVEPEILEVKQEINLDDSDYDMVFDDESQDDEELEEPDLEEEDY